jgi:hypothetical protein
VKLLGRGMYVLALWLAMAVSFPSDCPSICVCIQAIPIVSVWSDDPVRPGTGCS